MRRRLIPVTWVYAGCLASLFYLLPDVAPAQLTGLPQARRDAMMQQAHQIGLALVAYSLDNNLSYPDGKSSTEVFQKLLDGNYVTDPSVFYVDLPGKSKVVVGQKLKPENVCFDVTSGVDSGSPDDLPLVFLTGYKVTYAPGGAAVPLAKPYPPAIIVSYKNNSAKVLFPTSGNADGSIPNFISSNFNAQGKTYRQLTPNGTLP